MENWNFRAPWAGRVLLLLASHHVGDGGSDLNSVWSGYWRACRGAGDEDSRRAICEESGEAWSEEGLCAGGSHCPCRGRGGDGLKKKRSSAWKQERSCSSFDDRVESVPRESVESVP